MRIIFHIFWKDVKHHWPEILASLALLGVFLWDQPHRWSGQIIQISFLNRLLEMLPLFIALSWIVLVIRVVQTESLVGDRQFWITRPYEWPKLLAAKYLTVLLFVQLPLLMAQMLLLKMAYFPVVASLPSLLQIQMLPITIVLPAFALASLTRGFGHASLAALGLIVLILSIAGLVFLVPNLDFVADYFDSEQEFITFFACVAIIFVQYAFRKTRLGWLILTGACLSILGLVLISASPAIVSRYIPQPSAAHPLPAKLAFDSSLTFLHGPQQKMEFYGDEVFLELPLQVEDLPADSILQIAGTKLDLTMPDGEAWTSNWNSEVKVIGAGRTREWPSITIKKSVFRKAAAGRVHAHLSLAINFYKAGAKTSLEFKGDKLKLPGDVRCTAERDGRELKCFSALRGTGPIAIYSDLPNSGCPTSGESLEPWSNAPALYANPSGTASPNADFSPIEETSLSLSRKHLYEDLDSAVTICPGSALFLATLNFQYTVRAVIDLGEIYLYDYTPSYPRIIRPTPHRLPPSSPDKLSFDFDPPPLLGSHNSIPR